MIAKYAYPSSAARATISSRLARPSVRFVWVWRSPFSCRSVDHRGELARERRLHLASILAQGGLDVLHPETLVHALLGIGREQIARLRVEQPVFAQLQSLDGPPSPGSGCCAAWSR